MKKKIVVAATGASGAPLLMQCLKLIKEDGRFESCLIMSDGAKLTLGHETEKTEEEICALADDTFGFMDVTLKEQRTLVLAARETPLSAIHLRNMYELSMIQGVRIIPPMLTYYIKPVSVEEMTYHSAAKLVEPFGIEAPDYKRWGGIESTET